MQNAETVLSIIRERGQLYSRNRSLESHVTRKSVTRGSEGGGWKSAQSGNSLAAYPTHAGICAGAVG
jgi:hypothetical protein